jgi:hypothetical protein
VGIGALESASGIPTAELGVDCLPLKLLRDTSSSVSLLVDSYHQDFSIAQSREHRTPVEWTEMEVRYEAFR